MARIRTVKPEFFTSEDIMEISPLARLLYIALWCEADKEGRFAWRPKAFKVRYLPSDKCDIEAICNTLLARRLVIVYGDGLAVIPSFKAHQHINPREKDSLYPEPTPEELTREARVSDASVTRRGEGRKEGTGRKGKEPSLGKARDADDPATEVKPSGPVASEDDYKTARWMYGTMLKVNASAKAPNFDTWANEVRLMREIDKREHRDICEMFAFAKSDAFWSPNIQSPGKLREKWDVLTEVRARPAKQAANLWWATDASIIAKGAEFKLVPLPGESMQTFKGRIQATIDNDGKPPVQEMSRISSPVPIEPRGVKPEGLDLKALVGRSAPGAA